MSFNGFGSASGFNAFTATGFNARVGDRTLYLYALVGFGWRDYLQDTATYASGRTFAIHRIDPSTGLSIWSTSPFSLDASLPLAYSAIAYESLCVHPDGGCVLAWAQQGSFNGWNRRAGYKRYSSDGTLMEDVSVQTGGYTVFAAGSAATDVSFVAADVHRSTGRIAVGEIIFDNGVEVGPYGNETVPTLKNRWTAAKPDRATAFTGNGVLWGCANYNDFNLTYLRPDELVTGSFSGAELVGSSDSNNRVGGVWSSQNYVLHFAHRFQGAYPVGFAGAIHQDSRQPPGGTLQITKALDTEMSGYYSLEDDAIMTNSQAGRTYACYNWNNGIGSDWARAVARNGSRSQDMLHQAYVPSSAGRLLFVGCTKRWDLLGEASLDDLAATEPGIYRHGDATLFLAGDEVTSNGVWDFSSTTRWTRTIGDPDHDGIVSAVACYI